MRLTGDEERREQERNGISGLFNILTSVQLPCGRQCMTTILAVA